MLIIKVGKYCDILIPAIDRQMRLQHNEISLKIINGIKYQLLHQCAIFTELMTLKKNIAMYIFFNC